MVFNKSYDNAEAFPVFSSTPAYVKALLLVVLYVIMDARCDQFAPANTPVANSLPQYRYTILDSRQYTQATPQIWMYVNISTPFKLDLDAGLLLMDCDRHGPSSCKLNRQLLLPLNS